MSIHTQESVSGFIATDPKLTETATGESRLYLRFGQEHFRREEDGSFTQLETSYHHLVMFGRSAEQASERFAKGDSFLAEGYTHEYIYERDGEGLEGEEFVAKRIGHDVVRTRYEVDRSSRSAERQSVDRAPSKAFESPRSRPSNDAPTLGR